MSFLYCHKCVLLCHAGRNSALPIGINAIHSSAIQMYQLRKARCRLHWAANARFWQAGRSVGRLLSFPQRIATGVTLASKFKEQASMERERKETDISSRSCPP